MSYNLVDPTTGDLTKVAGGNNINDATTSTSTTWSSEKISANLADKQDFRIFKSLEEFNEKKGTSLTVVSGIDNMKDIANAMSNGEILIIITKYELQSDVYFGLDVNTGWTKMFTFIKSNGLCDVECRTTYPLTLKRVLNSDGVVGDWQEIITSDNIGSQTVAKANKIEPNYTSVELAAVTTETIKYIHLADCSWNQTGTLQVHLSGNRFEDTLVINFGGGNALTPMLCGYYSGNIARVLSVIAQKGSDFISNYSIYIKINQYTNCTVRVALLKGDCTLNISEPTTAPTNIEEWTVGYGLFGNITSPNITSLEQRVTALESKL